VQSDSNLHGNTVTGTAGKRRARPVTNAEVDKLVQDAQSQ
jgi:hypothetical protein